jgi:hypothetical protein
LQRSAGKLGVTIVGEKIGGFIVHQIIHIIAVGMLYIFNLLNVFQSGNLVLESDDFGFHFFGVQCYLLIKCIIVFNMEFDKKDNISFGCCQTGIAGSVMVGLV